MTIKWTLTANEMQFEFKEILNVISTVKEQLALFDDRSIFAVFASLSEAYKEKIRRHADDTETFDNVMATLDVLIKNFATDMMRGNS